MFESFFVAWRKVRKMPASAFLPSLWLAWRPPNQRGLSAPSTDPTSVGGTQAGHSGPPLAQTPPSVFQNARTHNNTRDLSLVGLPRREPSGLPRGLPTLAAPLGGRAWRLRRPGLLLLQLFKGHGEVLALGQELRKTRKGRALSSTGIRLFSSKWRKSQFVSASASTF